MYVDGDLSEVSPFLSRVLLTLNRYGVEYDEEPHGPGFHVPVVKKAGGKGTVPCLRLPEGTPEAAGSCVDGSTSILRWVDGLRASPSLPSLFPAPHEAEVTKLCEEFDSKLGPAVRKWNFAHNLRQPEFRNALVAQPVPAFERTVTLWSWPIFSMIAAAVRMLARPGSTSCGSR